MNETGNIKKELVKFAYIDYEEFKNLDNKLNNILYFISDGSIYKGNKPLNLSLLYIPDEEPLPINPSVNCIYIHNKRFKKYDKDHECWVEIKIDNNIEEEFLSKVINKYIKSYVDKIAFNNLDAAEVYAKDEKESTPGEFITIFIDGNYRPALIGSDREIMLIQGFSSSSGEIDLTPVDSNSISLSMDGENKLKANLKLDEDDRNNLKVTENGVFCGVPINVII